MSKAGADEVGEEKENLETEEERGGDEEEKGRVQDEDKDRNKEG